MKKVWEFFENLDEYVYVTDVKTNELIYMNRKTMETYGYHSLEQIKGKKCYRILQNSSMPCKMCNNKILQPEHFQEWRYYNPILKKYLLLKDTLLHDEKTGKDYRIEIAMDVGEEVRQGNVIENFQNLETLINEGLRIALLAPTPDQSIEVMLEYLGKTLHGDRTYIFEKDERGYDNNTYEWVADGVVPEKEELQNLPPEVCAHWYKKFQDNRCVVIHQLEDIREKDPILYEVLEKQSIHSLVVVPLYDNGKVIAFFGLDNIAENISFEYTQSMLQMTGYFFVSSMKQRNLVRKLQEISFHDQLTKLGNRFALEDYATQVDRRRSIGVVFCDITGLKRVNDSQGHIAGDKFIMDASECLKNAFGDQNNGLFRIGGDELLVLCPEITEKLLKKKIEELRHYIAEANVTMAIGYIWKPDASASLDELMTEAEMWMYKDKEAYYKQTGIDRRVR